MFIGKNYKIESDEMNVTLFKRSKSKEEDVENWRVIGYYAIPKEALQALVNLEIRLTELKDLQTVVDKIDELYSLIAHGSNNG